MLKFAKKSITLPLIQINWIETVAQLLEYYTGNAGVDNHSFVRDHLSLIKGKFLGWDSQRCPEFKVLGFDWGLPSWL
jgi:hypothetical protein